jgi:hypothetical protein
MNRLTLIALPLVWLAAGCVGTGGGSGMLDAAAAIDNPREFDLAEITGAIEFVPLDGSVREGLVGEIRGMTWTKDRFYITDNGRETPVKIFGRGGGFVSTLGRFGRGPGEFMGAVSLTADYDGGILYVVGQSGTAPIAAAYDASGREVLRGDSVSRGEGVVFHDGGIVCLMGSPEPFDFGNDPDFKSSIGTKVPLLKVFSAEMKTLRTVETTDKGTGSRIIVNTDGNGNVSGISVSRWGPSAVLSSNGKSLLVKEAMSDTLYHYRGGSLEAAWMLDFGAYTAPAKAFGLNPTMELGDSYTNTKDIFESDRWLFVSAFGQREREMRMLLFDKRDLPAGFSATGADGKHGLFLDGVPFSPCGIHDGRMVGYISALDIVLAVERGAVFSNAALATIAASTEEDGNPVMVVAELKR